MKETLTRRMALAIEIRLLLWGLLPDRLGVHEVETGGGERERDCGDEASSLVFREWYWILALDMLL